MSDPERLSAILPGMAGTQTSRHTDLLRRAREAGWPEVYTRAGVVGGSREAWQRFVNGATAGELAQAGVSLALAAGVRRQREGARA